MTMQPSMLDRWASDLITYRALLFPGLSVLFGLFIHKLYELNCSTVFN